MPAWWPRKSRSKSKAKPGSGAVSAASSPRKSVDLESPSPSPSPTPRGIREKARSLDSPAAGARPRGPAGHGRVGYKLPEPVGTPYEEPAGGGGGGGDGSSSAEASSVCSVGSLDEAQEQHGFR
nr:unnamed protein product [Digitaria exilis]